MAGSGGQDEMEKTRKQITIRFCFDFSSRSHPVAFSAFLESKYSHYKILIFMVYD